MFVGMPKEKPTTNELSSEEQATLGQMVGAIVDLEQEMQDNMNKAWQELETFITTDPTWTPSTTIRQVLTSEQLELWNDFCRGSEHPDAVSSIADKPYSDITFEDIWKILGIEYKDPPENGKLLVRFLMSCNSAKGPQESF